MRKIVTVQIQPDGTTNIDLTGFQGKGCEKVAADFRGDNTLLKSTKKLEYAKQDATQKARQGQ